MFQNKSVSEVLTNNLFSGLDGAAVSTVFNSRNFRGEKEGNIIYQAGDESKFLYIVLEGEVKLKFSGSHDSHSLIKKGKNEFFGEKELIDGTPRISSAVADTDCVLYTLNRQELLDLMSKYMIVRRNIHGIKDIEKQEEDETRIYNDLKEDSSYSSNNTQVEPGIEQGTKEEEERVLVEEGKGDFSGEGIEDSGDENQYEIEPPTSQDELQETIDILKSHAEPVKDSLQEEVQEPIVDSDDADVKWEFHKAEPVPTIETESSQSENSVNPLEEQNLDDKEESLEQQDATEKFVSPSSAEEKMDEVQEQKGESENYPNLPELTKYLTDNVQSSVSALKNYAALIRRKNISQEINQAAKMLSEEAESISFILETAFDYALGRSSMKTDTTNFSEVVNKILSLLSEYVETRNVNLFKKIESDALVKIDKDKFYQACFQIAKNACDAMPDGGNLYVTLKREEVRQGRIMKLEFRDEGAGIPLSIKEEIFEPFLSHGKSAGVGLGLTIAEKIIKDHNGSIKAEGEMGEGTTIVISIPCVE